MPIEKIDGCCVRCQPVAVKKKVVDLIGEDERLGNDRPLPQCSSQLHRLQKRDLIVIIALNQ